MGGRDYYLQSTDMSTVPPYYKDYLNNTVRGGVASARFLSVFIIIWLVDKFRWKKPEVLDTGSITEYDLPEDTDFEVEDVAQISEKKSQFDDVLPEVKEGEKKGQENSALELEEDTTGFT